MNAKNMKHDISYHLEANRFILCLEITNHSGGERRFYFSNDTGRLARNGIRLFNTKDEEIQACERAFYHLHIMLNRLLRIYCFPMRGNALSYLQGFLKRKVN